MTTHLMPAATPDRDDGNNIDGRLKILIKHLTEGTNNSWKSLEAETYVKAEKWRQFHRGSTKASGEMIESVSKRWPDFAYWLACGDTEPERGHIAPPNFENTFPVVRGTPQLWATEERLYKQRLLRKVPKDPDKKLEQDRMLRDEVFQVREKQKMPAVQLCYERIMRALDQDPKDELFLLEYDKELRTLRMQRWKAEKKLQETLYAERDQLGQSVQVEATLEKLLNLVRFW